MKKETKIFILIIVISVAFLTALDIQTKGKVTSLIGSVNPMNLKSSDVPYTNNSQSNVQDAIDDLYIKADTWIDPSSLDFKFNNTNKIVATRFGLCINRNNKLNCFKTNNYSVEKDHIQQVFSDISCTDYLSRVDCNASDFYCDVRLNGIVSCYDRSDYSYCAVYESGSVSCK